MPQTFDSAAAAESWITTSFQGNRQVPPPLSSDLVSALMEVTRPRIQPVPAPPPAATTPPSAPTTPPVAEPVNPVSPAPVPATQPRPELGWLLVAMCLLGAAGAALLVIRRRQASQTR